MRKLNSVRESIISVFKNLGRMLSLAWGTDKFLTVGYFGSSGLGAFFPIIVSYIFKIFIDELIFAQGITASLPIILVALLASKYLVNILWDFVMWGLKNTYFDFLFRYKLQNALNYRFYKKVSHLDIAHLENTKTQDLIAKAADTFTWRPPEFLRQFSYIFNGFIAYVSSFIILISYGWFMPVVVTLITLPRLYLRAKYGKLQWSIYGSGAPEVRKLWYYRWLLSEKSAIIETRVFRSQKSLLKKFGRIQKYLYEINQKPVANF